jgi:outer membrane protein TolC
MFNSFRRVSCNLALVLCAQIADQSFTPAAIASDRSESIAQGRSVIVARARKAPKSNQPIPSTDPNDPLYLPKTSTELQIQTTQNLSLQEALALALRRDRTLEQSQIALVKAQAALKEQKASLRPTVSLSVQNQTVNYFNSDLNNSSTFSGGLSTSQTLFDFGQRRFNIQAFQDRVTRAELEVERTTQDIRLVVAGYYYDLQNSAEQVRIYQSRVEADQLTITNAQAREQAGVGTYYDTLQAQTQLANDQVILQQNLQAHCDPSGCCCQ